MSVLAVMLSLTRSVTHVVNCFADGISHACNIDERLTIDRPLFRSTVSLFVTFDKEPPNEYAVFVTVNPSIHNEVYQSLVMIRQNKKYQLRLCNGIEEWVVAEREAFLSYLYQTQQKMYFKSYQCLTRYEKAHEVKPCELF